jgi:heptosyltransferase-3
MRRGRCGAGPSPAASVQTTNVHRLLIRPGAIGDCILSLPELESARASYTEVWVPRPVVPLIQFADRVRAIADTGLDLISIADDPRSNACLRDLASFDSIYSWYGSNRAEFRGAVSHLPFTFFPALPINVRAEGAVQAMPVPRITVPAVSIENFAVIHPFSGSAKKNWPLDLYRDLARRLNMPVKWCAGPRADEALSERDSFDNAVHIENLYDLAAWLAAARVYVGNDSGITHLAAAVGVPVVAIFLSTDPRVWAPRGNRVSVLENPDVDHVLAAVAATARPPFCD